MKKASLNKLAEMVDGSVRGDGEVVICGLSSLELAQEGEISFVAKVVNDALPSTSASALIVPEKSDELECPTIVVKNPFLASAIIHSWFLKEPFAARGIHETAVIGSPTEISDQVSIGANVSIGKNVVIGDRVSIESGTFIGDNVIIDDDTIVNANVSILDGSKIGKRTIIHSGTVIGSDGYGYVHDAYGVHHKRPQIGTVQIGDDVEIGSNCCVDRATFGMTVVGAGTKIDNLVQVGHNVEIGEHCLIVAQVGIAGSSTFGRNVVMGGQSAVAGHVHIGDGAMIAARGGVHTNVKPGAKLGGAPTIPIEQFGRATAVFNRLPELRKEVRALRKELELLKKNK